MTSSSAPLDKPLYGATFGQAVTRFFTKYATFTGRASRSEYLWAVLFIVVVAIVIWVPGIILGIATGTPTTDSYGRPSTSPGPAFIPFAVVGILFYLGVIVPGIALSVRRLHDANFSGLMYLLVFVPSIGSIIVLVFCLLASNPSGARFDVDAARP